MAEAATLTDDPRQKEAKPPFPADQQPHPGSDAAMSPKADHGEQSYRGSGKLTDCAALITGADSGIGRAVALAYAREGADVVVSYLNEDDDARETERLVRDAGRRAVLVPGDVRDEGHCRELVERVFREFCRFDILVSNAAYQMSQESIADVTAEQFERTYRTNVFALFYLCKAALPQLPAGGSVIATASIQAFDPSPQLLDYASTKCAIVGFTKALAKQAMNQGVRVNAVAPGPVWTPLIPSTMPAEKVKEFGKSSVFGRPAQPAELAPLYVWLASKEASYVTGEVLGATGGQMPY